MGKIIKQEDNLLPYIIALGVILGLNVLITLPMIIHSIDVIREFWGWK